MAASHILMMNSITRNDFDKKQRSETIFLSIKLYMRLTYARRHFENGFFIDKKMCFRSLLFVKIATMFINELYARNDIFKQKKQPSRGVLKQSNFTETTLQHGVLL